MAPQEQTGIQSWLVQWLIVIVAVYVLRLAVGVIGTGFRQVFGGAEGVESLFVFATNPFVGLVLVILATALIQSSSTVTSIIVGLVAGGMPIAVAIPMVMGANVGTTVTALLAATAITGANHAVAHQIAIAHFLYNLLGVVVIYSIPWLRWIPVAGAEWIARLGSERKSWAIAYNLAGFFGIPGALVFGSAWLP